MTGKKPSQPSKPPPDSDDSPESGKSPLFNAGTGRSRTYSQSYQATIGSGTLRHGNILGGGSGYGALSERGDPNVTVSDHHHTTTQGEAKGKRGQYSRWGGGGLSGLKWGSTARVHTEAVEKAERVDHSGRGGGGWGRRRIFVLAGMLLLGSGALWTLTQDNRQDHHLDLPSSPLPLHSKSSTTPDKNGYIHLITLPFNIHHAPPKPSPPPAHTKPKPHASRRLILVGDVHGALDELKALLEKVDFDPGSGTDHLVLTGDMVAKGPKSGGVLDLMRKLSDDGVASCVRGNHDDRVVRAYKRLHRKSEEEEKEGEKVSEKKVEQADGDEDANETEASQEGYDTEEEIHGNFIEDWLDTDLLPPPLTKKGAKRRQRKRASDEAVAKTLTPAQAEFLDSCPLILRVHGAGHQGGELLVVHAGIVPGVPLLKQNPELLMNMRSILPPKGAKGKSKKKYKVGKGSSTTKGRHWAGVWNEWEDRRVKGDLEEEELKMPEVLKGLEQDAISVEVLGDDEPGQLVQGEKAGDQVVPVKTEESEESTGNPETGVTVVYGHYAAKGLDIRRWTKGLDSNCVRGERLSALVVKTGGKGKVDMDVVSVKCRKYAE